MTPLAGRRVVVTRRPGQSSRLVDLLEARGATVVEVPAIEVAAPPDPGPLDEALGALERYEWVVFTSPNAVSAVLGRIVALGLEPRLGARGPRLASIGPSTTAALRSSFPADRVSLEPDRDFRAAGLVEAFERGGVRGARLLLPASSRVRRELADGLSALGAAVDVVTAYDVVEPVGLSAAVARCLDEGFDLALFASPSAVESFARAAGGRAEGLPAVVIGPTTEAAARGAGMAVVATARPSTAEGLVQAAEAATGSAWAPRRPLTRSD